MPIDAVVVRRMMPQDLSALWDMHRDADLSPRRYEEFCAYAHAHTTWVLLSHDQVVGGAVVQHQADRAELLVCVVALAHRTQGLGRRLLTQALPHDCPVYLELSPHNRPARALYQRLGFEVIGQRPRYYPNGDDALVMRRDAVSALEPRDR